MRRLFWILVGIAVARSFGDLLRELTDALDTHA